ncbi:MAG: antibiotic biosynthesis monooxygenase [Bacteroidetes bacterium]|nr:MAG: antibiotic biosynthesis monooxygenase [Bacteroidota bacterium]
MIAVIFEVFPKEGKWDEYLDLAAHLRSELNKIEGFISIERFQSMTDKEKVLSLSFWKDEESISQWRNVELHRQAQANGRSTIFNDYRLRVAQVLRDYSMTERKEAPADSIIFHKK